MQVCPSQDPSVGRPGLHTGSGPPPRPLLPSRVPTRLYDRGVRGTPGGAPVPGREVGWTLTSESPSVVTRTPSPGPYRLSPLGSEKGCHPSTPPLVQEVVGGEGPLRNESLVTKTSHEKDPPKSEGTSTLLTWTLGSLRPRRGGSSVSRHPRPFTRSKPPAATIVTRNMGR